MRELIKLHSIVDAFEKNDVVCDIETISRYKKSLLVLYGADAVLIVTDVFNAVQYGKVCASDQFSDAVIDYVDSLNLESEQEKNDAIELINFQSLPLSKL